MITYSHEEHTTVKSGTEAVRRVLMGNDTQAKERLLSILLEQCKSIFLDLQKQAASLDPAVYGEMPSMAIIQYHENGGTEIGGYRDGGASYTWKLEEGRITIAPNTRCQKNSPVSGMYYPEASFLVSCNPAAKTAYLIYQLGPRFGRCFTYDVNLEDGPDMKLACEQVVWVS